MSSLTLNAYAMEFTDYGSVVAALRKYGVVRLVGYCKTHAFPVITAQKALKERRSLWKLRMAVDRDDLLIRTSDEYRVNVELGSLVQLPITPNIKLPDVDLYRCLSLDDIVELLNQPERNWKISFILADLKAQLITEDTDRLVNMGYSSVYLVDHRDDDAGIEYTLQGRDK